MTLTDIPLASGLRRLFDLAIETVLCGVRRFRRGDANATAAEALSLRRRLTRLMRYAFVLAATALPPLAPSRASPCATPSAMAAAFFAPRGLRCCFAFAAAGAAAEPAPVAAAAEAEAPEVDAEVEAEDVAPETVAETEDADPGA